MSEQIISKTITSPKPATATRTQQGWSLPSPKTETYADKVKMSKKPLDVKFNLTPLGFTTQHQKERQKKTEWKRSLFKLIKNEDDETETELTWYNTKQLIQGTLMQIDMYITSTDMDNNKDRIKRITNDDQEAFNTIWELAQNTTKKLNEKKKTWIQALEQAIEKEFNIQTGSGTEEDSKKPLHRSDNSDFQTIDHGHLESILKSFEEKFEEKLNRRYGFQPLPQQPSTVQSGGGSLDTFPPTLGQCHNEK